MKHFLLVLFSLFSLNTFAQGSLEGDRLTLVALYNSAGGGSWTNKTGWVVPGSAGDNPCGWYGITCSGGRVTSLDLSNNNMGGTLPPEIGELSELKSLNLGFSTDFGIPFSLLGGAIPTQLGNLTKLEYLDLSGNDFTGSIPSSIGNLLQLTYLDLHYVAIDAGFDPFGFISGSIPPELGNLANLTYLEISNQSLTGNLPAELGNLTELKTLSLGTNDFSGTIPASFNNFSQIQLLDLSFFGYQRSHEFGLLHGPIPNLSGMPALAKIYIPNQSFTFDGMETNISRFAWYSGQSKIPMSGYFPLSSSSGPGGMLFVEAGGALANNTYKWYKDGVLVSTNIGINYFNAYEFATYRVEVTNSIATQLTLISDDYTVSSLPVKLISFSGKNSENQNLLTWKTTSETNNSGFDIEKSKDAKSFKKIGFVDGSGDSKENKTYSFTDQTPFITTYYRLKQIDYDGKFEYSRIISVKNDYAGISIYPNPAANNFFVKDLENEEKAVIRNITGQVILQQNVIPGQSVNSSNLTSGIYTITIGGNTRKVVIQK